jgi:hypothetical protein
MFVCGTISGIASGDLILSARIAREQSFPAISAETHVWY